MLNLRLGKGAILDWVVFLLGLALSPGLTAQVPDPCKDIQVGNLSSIVPLDNTGISNWDYLNPRKPYPLVPLTVPVGNTRAAECYRRRLLEGVSLTFENRTLDRGFDIKLPLALPLAEDKARELAERLADVRGRLERDTLRREIEALRVAVRELQDSQTALADLAEREKAGGDSTGVEIAPEALSPEASVQEILEVKTDLTERIEEASTEKEEAERRLADLEALNRMQALAPRRDPQARSEQNRLREQKETAERSRAESTQEIDRLQEAKEQLDTVMAARAAVENALNRAAEMAEEISPGSSSDIYQLVPPAWRPGTTDLLDLRADRLLRSLDAEVEEAPPVARRDCPGVIEDPNDDRNFGELLKDFGSSGYTAGTIDRLVQCLTPLRENLGVPPDDPDFLKLQSAVVYLERSFNQLATGTGSARTLGEICQEDRPVRILRCAPILRVQPGQDVSVAQDFFSLFVEDVVTFEVRFTADPELPANNRGYLATVLSPKEPPDTSRWAFSGGVSGVRDPDPVPDRSRPDWKLFSADAPYDGGVRRHAVGSGNLQLTQKLGNRAEGSATLSFKEGDFGAVDGNLGASISEYKLNLFSDNGWQLRFGKYTMASPQGRVAVNEAGEGVELRYRWLSLGHIISRESRNRTANDQDEDRNVTIFQASNLFSRTGGVLRGMNVIALYGTEDARKLFKDVNRNGKQDAVDNPATAENEVESDLFEAYDYGTVGLETYFGTAGSKVSGSAAYYYSKRELESREATGLLSDGSGSSVLVTASWNQIAEPSSFVTEVARSFRVQVGWGSGDDPETPKDEGYLGESGAFSPDKVFLSRFAGSLEYDPFLLIPRGLSNKTYLGLSYIENRVPTLLEIIPALFGIREKVISRSMTIQLHQYRFNERILNNREIGEEVGIEFSMQVPKGVTSTLSLARFFPADSLQPLLFNEEPWVATIGVKVSL
jgi:hypothetical protein